MTITRLAAPGVSPGSESGSFAPRIACYSHDTVGLGHIRRNIAVATSMINRWPDADAMLITGNPEATSLWLPPRTDVVTLPTVAKDASGRYRSRTLNASLDTVITMRSAVIEAAVTSFRPDLLIVDKVPLGVAGELLATLRRLRDESDTKIILGLREILDDPVTAVEEWTRGHTTEAITSYYDAVWIYGDQDVYDPVAEYGLPIEVSRRCTSTGYLAADRFGGADADAAVTEAHDRPYVLCTVGGGQDGGELARTFAATPPPEGHDGIVVCGPFMAAEDRAAIHDQAAANPRLRVLDFVPDLHRLIGDAAAVVSMAGYNSVCEVLATDRPALFVPRSRPRAEQLIRAERLVERGLADLLPFDALRTDALASWCRRAVETSTVSRDGVDIDGLRRIPDIAQELLVTCRRPTERAGHRAA